MYRQQFQTIADLKAVIRNKISIIRPTVLESVVTSFENLLDEIIVKNSEINEGEILRAVLLLCHM